MNSNDEKIAVIGISGRFPGAKNIHEFWNNLLEGKETIHHFSDDELSKYEHNYNELKRNPNYVKSRGILDNIDMFDANFFGYTPKEAAMTDPQHRIWLETAWEALEDAGCDPFTSKYMIGVFAGGYMNTYLLNNVLRDPEKLESFIRLRSAESFQLWTGSDIAFLPTKTAYKFNLHGPAINVQTACSTSLVAVAQACQSLLNYESDICLAGGVYILIPQETGYIFQEDAISSPDGHCRPFDANAKGTVFSNGIGIAVLKRLDDAIKDHDRIYATVNGWAVNNDGNTKMSYTAPSINGQCEVIQMAHNLAGINSEEIGYIETHGTATALGDPIEIAALNKAFSAATPKKQFCGIGSVKSNIGHTDAAAGIASFIKSCLSIYHRIIPPSINYSNPNPHINFRDSPFYVLNYLKKWNLDKPLYIGVSSFGIGGTNAHIVLGESPSTGFYESNTKKEIPELIVLSAKTEKALQNRKTQFISHLRQHPEIRLSDLSFTLQFGRNHMEHRTCLAVSSIDEIVNDTKNFYESNCLQSTYPVAFVFPGQGAQYTGMGKELYQHSILFKNVMNECFFIFEEETGENLKNLLFEEDKGNDKLHLTQFAQPALFCIEYALAKLYESLGINPEIMIGHSIGEYTAACLSGVFDLQSALKIVIKRGQLMQKMPEGKMLAVNSSRQRLADLSSNLFEIAADNAQEMCTISCNTKNLEHIKSVFNEKEISYTLLNTSHAFHSEAFNPILQDFELFVNQFQLNPPAIPFISCLTGSIVSREFACSGHYWASQLRNIVQFSKGISEIVKSTPAYFLEVGPSSHLSSLIRRNSDVTNKRLIISSLDKKDTGLNEFTKIIQSIGKLWSNGYPVNFGKIRNMQEKAHKISLPAYPWERQRYWIDYYPEKDQKQFYPESDVPKNINLQASSIETKESIRMLLSELSGFSVQNLNENTNFIDFGFDSLFLAQFAREVEKKYNSKILFRQLANELCSIKKLSEYIDSASEKKHELFSSKNYRNLGILSKTGDKTPFVLVHGSNSVNFLSKHFQGERPILNFFDLGSDGEKIPSKNIEEMAKDYIEQLMELAPDGPYILCGFSFGGLLAYKMAEMLNEKGTIVPCVIMFDTNNPQTKEVNKISKLRLTKKNKVLFLALALWKRFKNIKFYKIKIYLLLNKPLPVRYRRFYISSVYGKLSLPYKPVKINSELLLFRSDENLTPDLYLGWKGLPKKMEMIILKGNHHEIINLEENYQIIINKIESFLRTYKDKKNYYFEKPEVLVQ